MVGDRAAEFGHEDAGLGGLEPVNENRLVRMAGLDDEEIVARSPARRGGPLVHAPARRISLMPFKEEAGVGGASGSLVAMGAVDVEPGASAVFERGVAERVGHGRRR